MTNIQPWELILNNTNKTSGSLKMKCPCCSETRKNKQDKSVYVNFTSGVGKCFNDSCNALFFRDSNKKEFEEKTYTLPPQEWKNYTELSDNLVKWCEDKRKINQFTLKQMNISEEKYWQPALNKEVNNIVFNYFEGDLLVNKKYRSSDKKFTQSKNGKPIFYNINAVIGEDEIYIVEGEFDVLALYQVGIKNVISVPNGANDNDNYWLNSEKYLKDVKKFFIATDNDTSGDNVAEKIAQRLGRYRCERVIWKGKDANDDLITDCILESVLNRKKYPVSGTFTSDDLLNEVEKLYQDGLPKCIELLNPAMRGLNNVFKLMLGHLCVSTGIPSHGKSNLTEWLVLNYLLENDFKASFFSPEHQPMALHISTFAQKIIGKNFFYKVEETPRMTQDELKEFMQWSNQKLYLTTPDAGQFANWDWLMEKFQEQLYSFGINIFVIDAYNKIEHASKGTERENISKVLSRLTSFAQQNNVLIILVAHPTKMKRQPDGSYEKPTLYDVAGSADFRNQTHDGYCVYRDFTKELTVFENLKTKYPFQGQIGGQINLKWHKPSGRYYEEFSEPQEYNLLQLIKDNGLVSYSLGEIEDNTEIENNNYFPTYNSLDDVPF